MIVELQLHDGTLIAVGDLSWEGVPLVGDRLVVKDKPSFYKTHAALGAMKGGLTVKPESAWYGRVRVCSRKFVYCHVFGYQAVLELTVEDLASGESARGESDWSEPNIGRAKQAKADVEARIAKEGIQKATVHYLYEAMRAAQSNLRAYAPLMLEIDEVLRRNGFEK
jgi:hypothetical protein